MAHSTSAQQIERDTVELARRLIACRSITPDDGGCLEILASRLSAAGFRNERLDRGEASNLWARRGTASPLVCLAGHVDVVPPGAVDQWTSEPFTPTERDGFLYGRGAADMKAPLAAMVTAVERVVAANPGHQGSLAVLLTSDEEGAATDGTVAVVETLRGRGDAIDFCVVGEPTSSEALGDTMKNGRRGSLSAELTVRGAQHHIAYPERGRNPIHMALAALTELASTEWDQGNEYFPPTSFQIASVQASGGAVNVVPGTMGLHVNFRFSPESSPEQLQSRVKAILDRHGVVYDLTWTLSGSPFLTPRGHLVDVLSKAAESVTGRRPQLSTSGGMSDGRFIAAVAREIVEFGPLNESIHKVNERVAVADLGPLSTIYERTINGLLG